jgi:hypothetical protein
MSLSLAIAIIVLADLALLGDLAWCMSLPRKLTPHVSAHHNGELLSTVPAEAAQSDRPVSIAA